MFRGDAGKWSRWDLGFLWGLEGGGSSWSMCWGMC